MKKKHYYWLAGIAALTIGFSFFVHKTKKVKFEWNTEDEDFNEHLCQNCKG